MVGKEILHYKIIEKIGEGGMGVVYKAEDTKLDRYVSLKFLPAHMTHDSESRDRFIHEAQAASALEHHNICTIHDIVETDEGVTFMVMPFYEGESLKNKINRGPLSINDTIRIASQIIEGLEKAHQKSIIHRDIKPANIFITEDGMVKILDFGLAKLRGQTKVTKAGTTLGTAAYMSPEQARGDEVDQRSDIWSLGVVIFEMITGQAPFKGDYDQALTFAILNESPEPLTSLRTGVPKELERIVNKCLQKDVNLRYQTMSDLLADLRGLDLSMSESYSPKTAVSKTYIPHIKKPILITGVILIVLISLIIIFQPFKSSVERYEDKRKLIVVLPFENLGSSEDEYFADGITDAITARLTGVSGLGVISRQSAIQYKGTNKTIREIGAELGVDFVLEGTIQRERPNDPSSRVRVIPQLIRVSDDTHIWAETYDDKMSDMFRVQSEIAEKVAAQMDVKIIGSEQKAIESRPTANMEAYEFYLRAVNDYNKGENEDLKSAVRFFNMAVSLDEEFVEAWAGLSLAHHRIYWAYDKPDEDIYAKEAAEKARSLDPDNPDTYLALGYVAYSKRQFEDALSFFQKSYEKWPGFNALESIGYALRRLGKWEEALEHFKQAHRLTPVYARLLYDDLGFTNICLRRYTIAKQYLNKAIAIDPKLVFVYVDLATLNLLSGEDLKDARQILINLSYDEFYRDGMGFGQGWIKTSQLRLFPEFWIKLLNTFESEYLASYRNNDLITIAMFHLTKGIVLNALNEQSTAQTHLDSASIYYQRILRSNLNSPYIPAYRSNLALVLVRLNQYEEAIREAESAVQTIPVERDAVVGSDLMENLAEVYLLAGRYDKALDQLQKVFSIPSYFSVQLIEIDPMWEPIRNHPRFLKLIDQYSVLQK